MPNYYKEVYESKCADSVCVCKLNNICCKHAVKINKTLDISEAALKSWLPLKISQTVRNIQYQLSYSLLDFVKWTTCYWQEQWLQLLDNSAIDFLLTMHGNERYNFRAMCFPWLIKKLTRLHGSKTVLNLTSFFHTSAHGRGAWESDYSQIKTCLTTDTCGIIK